MMTSIHSDSQFNGRRFIITGATSGIGHDLVVILLNLGASVVGIGREESKIDDLLKKYSEDRFLFVNMDLSRVEDIESNFERDVFSTLKFDGLILCAGKEETLPLGLYKREKVLDIFNVNVFSNIELLRIFSKKKVSNDGSSIVFLSSVMSELGEVGKMGYCASKSALLGVVKSSALELIKRSIRVNAVAPGIVQTPMTDKLFTGLTTENVLEIEKMHPGGFGKTSDVTSIILFLLSDQSRWITGQNIKIDGGYSIR